MPEDKEQLKKLIQENIRLTKNLQKLMVETRDMTKYVKHYAVIANFFSWLKIIFIAVPLILGFIYLPPLLQDFFAKYQLLFTGDIDPTSSLNSLLKNQK